MADLKKWVTEKRATDGEDLERELLEALWLHQAHNFLDRELLVELLNAKRFEVRAAAVRVLSYWQTRLADPLAMLRPRIADSHPRVRLEAVRACSFLPRSDELIQLALDVLSYETDPWIEYTLEETMRGLGQ